MVEIIDNVIKLTRGDSLYLEVAITDSEGNSWTPGENDKIEFTVKASTTFKDILISKQGKKFQLTWEDTKDMPYGKYYYDIQVTLENGDRNTIIAPIQGEPNFILTDEVNWT